MNELQKQDLKIIKEMLPGAHHIDLVIRTGGKDYYFQGDFLKQILMELEDE